MRRQVSVAWAELGPVQRVAIEPAVPAARRARGVAGRMERPVSREQARKFFSLLHEEVERTPCVGRVFHG